MKTRIRTPDCQDVQFISACALLLALSLVFPRSLLAENNTDYVVDGTISNVSSVNIPTNSPGTNNSLQILNGGIVNNSGIGQIGVSSGDNNNYALVSGTNSLGAASTWTNSGDLFIGAAGTGNQLIITNQGQVIGTRTIVGYNFGANGNIVTVTGTNSLLNNTTGLAAVQIGWSGGLNQLIITNGGRVNDSIGNVGSVSASASNNLVVVSGAGSIWSNSSTFNFGQGSRGNSLTISSGGRVDVGGDFNSYNGLANNSVLVTGSNSLLSLPSSALYMSGDNALLTIANGGRVIDSAAYLGYTSSTNNVAIVTDAGSVWSNSTLTVGHFQGSGVQLIITNGGVVASSAVTLGNFSTSKSNTVMVTGSNSLMTLTGNLFVGNNGGLNKLIISDGGRVNNSIGYVGYNAASASNNSIVVTGAGSVWSNASSLNVGFNAGGNSLTISNSGRVDAAQVSIGSASGVTDNNTVLVTGSNSLLSAPSSFVEIGGNNAALTIANGGRVVNSSGYIGNGNSTATNIVVVVTGAGSQWTNSSDLYAGYTASGTQMIITNGGRVDSNRGFLGRFNPSTSNTVVVTGSNSLWNIGGDLSVGFEGGGYNQLLITDGGRVNNAAGNVGSGLNAANNSILVSGAGSVWSNSSFIKLGLNAGGNTLTIANGGRVDAANLEGFTDNNSIVVTGSNSLLSSPSGYMQIGGNNSSATISDGGQVIGNDGYFGSSANGTNSVVTVSGPGSKWTMSGTLYAGQLGKQNSLIITNGGRVDDNIAYISFGLVAGSNKVIVTGSNSVWNHNSHLYVGYQGNGSNQLIISDGGLVKNNIGYVGYNVASVSNNSILVTGAGSTWTNVGSLNLGYVAGGNLLTIANGGRVDSADGSVGVAAGATPDNRVVVTGSNSLWSMAGGLGIGGHNAQVTIADGGRIISSDGFIGNGNSTSTNVSVTVTGADSRWTMSGDLNVGWLSSGTSLVITNGGRIDSNRGWIGRFNPSSNNLATVTGSNSLWNITGDLFMANDGPGSNQLRIVDGGRVKNNVAHIGYGLTGSNNSVLVSGPDSVWSNTGTINLGENAGGNVLVVTNSGRVDAAEMSIGGPAGSTPNNRLLVTGNGSLLSMPATGFGLGIGGHNAQVTVSAGGRIINSDGYIGNGPATATNIGVIVTGAGSVWSNAGTLNAGYTASGTSLLIANGGRVDAAQTFVGRLASSTNNSVIVTGAGSFFGHRLMLWVGNNGIGLGSGTVLVDNGGTIESIGLISGSSGSGTISNRAGIYQFTTAAPTITTNTAGSIMMTNGTVSYRDVALADINNLQVDNITRQGNNTWRLNHSSNLLVTAYTFESVANTGNPLIYRTLSATNGSHWRSVSTTIGTNGLAVGGGADTFEFSQNFLIHSTNNLEFNLRTSTVVFSGVEHTNSITGRDLGGVEAGFYDNFAYGTLRLGSPLAEVCFQSGDGAASNALYMTFLDLPLSMTNFVMNLHAPTNINLYYLVTDPRNAYLGGNEYQLTDCDGVTAGGFLLPAVPEPSSLLLLSIAACAIFWRKSRHA